MEFLERRRLLAAVRWDGGGDGVNWSSANNWSTNKVPTSADDVTINVSANPTVTVSAATAASVKSLTTSEKMKVAGSLKIATTAKLAAVLNLAGGRLEGGVWTINGGANILPDMSAGNRLKNLSVSGTVTMSTADSRLIFDGVGSFTKLVLVGDRSELDPVAGSTLKGRIEFAGYFSRINPVAGSTLTLDTGTVLSSTRSSYVSAYNAARDGFLGYRLVNKGAITQTGNSLILGFTSVSNTGSIAVGGNAVVDFGLVSAAYSTADIGKITVTNGSAVTLNGAIENAGRTLTLNAATGTYTLTGKLHGGVVKLLDGARLRAAGVDPILDGVNVQGTLYLFSPHISFKLAGAVTANEIILSNPDTTLYLSPGSSFAGVITIDGGGVVSVSGAGDVTLPAGTTLRVKSGAGRSPARRNRGSSTVARSERSTGRSSSLRRFSETKARYRRRREGCTFSEINFRTPGSSINRGKSPSPPVRTFRRMSARTCYPARNSAARESCNSSKV